MLTEYAQRMAAEPWRRWYKTAHWARTRAAVLARDPICKICNRFPSTVADHIKPHKGDHAKFVESLNLQGLCAACHNEKTAREDGGFGRAPQPNGERETSTSVGKDAIAAALEGIEAIANLNV
jgi:5-methylcytosine-specific restriction protein A